MDFFGTYFTHVQTYMISFVLTASVHTLQRSKPETTCVFEVLRNGLLRYILYTCPNLYDNVRVDCLGAYFTHVQTYMITFVLTASVHALQRSKPETTCVFEVLRNGLLRYILYTCPNLYDNVRVDCLGAYFTHVQTYMITFVLTASVHTLHMSKPMITFVFILPRNGLLNLIKLAQTHCFLGDPYV